MKILLGFVLGVLSIMVCVFQPTGQLIFAFGQQTFESRSIGDKPYDFRELPRGYVSNGYIRAITIGNPNITNIVIEVSTTNEDGRMKITLPRWIIDAKLDGCSGSDDAFLVFVDDVKENFQEKKKTPTERILMIPVAGGTKEVTIVGTCAVPEFPISVLITSLAIGLMVVIIRLSNVRLFLR